MRFRLCLGTVGLGVVITTAVCQAAPAAANVPGGAPVAGGVEIFNANSYFRWRRVTRETSFADGSGPAAAPADFAKRKPPLSPNPEDEPPPATWTGVQFDDSAWPRLRPGAENVADGQAMVQGAFRLCLRGRFEVTDPSVIRELVLPGLQFQGGMVVYLNGREVARAFLPEGPLADSAEAAVYPDEAWPIPGRAPANKDEAAKTAAARASVQNRRLGPVRLSDLKSAKSDATIPAAAAELLTARSDGRAYMRTNWFDGLTPGVPTESPVLQIKPYNARPIDDAAMLPIYVRLNVPRTAAPGDYRGSVTVRVAGEHPVIVPVKVYVSPWTLPDPKDYRTYVGLYQSPTSVALQYKVDEWSERHWKLLDKSLALLGRAGNKMINVCVVEQTQFGNDQGMVYWIRRPDGTFDYDFTVFDRFVALAKKHFGTLDYVALQVWHSGGWETRKADQQNTVTVIDPVTKKRDRMQVPKFDRAEARKFWRPFLAQAREHLAKVGLDKAMCIGILSDGTAPSSVFTMFDEIWPGGGPARWTRGLHTQREDKKPYRADRGGGVVVLHEHCYGSPMMTVGDALTGLSTFRGAPVTAYFRFSGFETVCTINGYRLLTDNALFLRKQGIGRIGFDFWDVVPTRRDDYGYNIYNRYPHSSCAQRAPALYKLSWPGPDGAETTQRFEVLCQGVQETEGMLAVAAALDSSATMDKTVADCCRKVLYDRLWFVTTRPMSAAWSFMLNHVNHYGWQELARSTFDRAAEASGRFAER